jgi:hypothetical protein
VKVASVHDRIWIAETCAKRVTQIDGADVLGGHRIHKPQFVDIHGHLTNSLAHPKAIEHVKGVRTELNTRAELTQFGSPLEDRDGNVVARQSECRG